MRMLSTAVYTLCALASVGCAILLFRLFWRHRRRTTRLALWTGLSFTWFAISNALVLADLVVEPSTGFAAARAATACLAAGLLLFGLIWETE
jgi:hypothetical protein